ncbi:MAG: PKD domain-containing protein, partial [Bacteroidota bacterium]
MLTSWGQMRCLQRHLFAGITGLSAILTTTSAQPPEIWLSRGVGGGGALFGPSISPHDTKLMYMGCDMSECFRTEDSGKTWRIEHFRDIQGPSSVLLQASQGDQEITWYDADLNAIGSGTSFQTALLEDSTTFYVRAEEITPLVGVEPSTVFFGVGGNNDDPQIQYLEFSVQAPIVLETAITVASGAGTRTVQLWDDNGILQNEKTFNLGDGLRTLDFNWNLAPGNYRIGGASMDLYANSTGAAYPYESPGLISITGSSAGSDAYFFFYNMQVRELACISEPSPLRVFVSPPNGAMADFEFSQNYNSIDFVNMSSNAGTYQWNFGDGNTSEEENPNHKYTQIGTYTVTLSVQNGPCTDVYTQEVVVNIIPGDFLFEAELQNINDAYLHWVVSGAQGVEKYEVEFAYTVSASDTFT